MWAGGIDSGSAEHVNVIAYDLNYDNPIGDEFVYGEVDLCAVAANTMLRGDETVGRDTI